MRPGIVARLIPPPPREPWQAGVLAELSCTAHEAPSLMDLNPKGAHSLCATHVSLFSLPLSPFLWILLILVRKH
ncbi:hypothetical protein LY76DRAFT_276983 [Colletotrichum caudatum]|nr:hypothetical protein LY76DRAFT_276983 [Colletotrichum caudatum]